MTLTLDIVASQPHLVTYKLCLVSGETVILRPLEPNDDLQLAEFLRNLSPQTREFCTYDGYDLPTAREFCAAINRYDKLRFVVVTTSETRIIALLEYSFDITQDDQQRYMHYQQPLNAKTDCRFGPCLADDYQNRGLGQRLFPYLKDVAQQFRQTRIILWGGVLTHNHRAIHYYERLGFKRVGTFKDQNGIETLDMILEI